MKRIAAMVLFLVVTTTGAATAATNVDVQATGQRHFLGGALAVRGRYESRSWDLDLNSITPMNTAVASALDDMRFNADTSSFGAELILSVGRRVELRGILALGEIELDGRRGTARLDLDTDIELLYGFGARVGFPAIWPPGWDMNIDFEFLTGSFDRPDFYFTGGGPLATAGDIKLDWKQISVSPTISKDLGIITPYGGLRFATADADLNARVNATLEEISFENEDLLSIVLGTRFRLGSFISGDAHVDLLNNEGFVISVLVRF